MDHFIHEKYDFRLLCIRYLASKGWRWFGEELDDRQGERVDAYLRGGDASLLDAIDEPEWYTSGVLASNADRYPKAAFDAEQRRFHETVRRSVPGARWFGFDIGRDDDEYIRQANAANTFEELRPVMALRERLMHERVAGVIRDNPGEKIALMAGSTHLMKDDSGVDTPGVGAGPGGDTDDSIATTSRTISSTVRCSPSGSCTAPGTAATSGSRHPAAGRRDRLRAARHAAARALSLTPAG